MAGWDCFVSILLSRNEEKEKGISNVYLVVYVLCKSHIYEFSCLSKSLYDCPT